MEDFVENENHTLADYQFKCRICTIKLEMGDSNIIIDEDKANFYAITGQKLRSNINFSTIICSICRRDLIFCVYFKNKVKEIQNYLNQKGEDCKNCSDSDEEVIVLEGYPTFSLNNFEDDELPESISELSEYEITDVLPTRLNDAPVVNQYKDLKIVASTFATIQKTINEGCDRKNPEPLKVDQYKPLIVDIDEINKKKKENKCKSVRKKYKPNKLSTKPEETLVLQNNTINVSHDIKSPEKFMKKGFPPISARRKSERNVNKKIAATIVPQETLKKIKVRAEPMLTRSKAKPEGPKKVVPFNIKDWMITPKPKKVIPKLEEQNVIPGM